MQNKNHQINRLVNRITLCNSKFFRVSINVEKRYYDEYEQRNIQRYIKSIDGCQYSSANAFNQQLCSSCIGSKSRLSYISCLIGSFWIIVETTSSDKDLFLDSITRFVFFCSNFVRCVKMVIVTKKGELTTTVTESGRVLNSLARGRLLRVGVRVPYYIKGDVS